MFFSSLTGFSYHLSFSSISRVSSKEGAVKIASGFSILIFNLKTLGGNLTSKMRFQGVFRGGGPQTAPPSRFLWGKCRRSVHRKKRLKGRGFIGGILVTYIKRIIIIWWGKNSARRKSTNRGYNWQKRDLFSKLLIYF